MEKKFNYVYVVTNLVNGKQYIGDHCTNKLDDNYLGSGRLLNKKINEYGKENFEKEILEFFNTKEESFDAQEKYIQEYNTLVPNGYNISPKGGYGVPGSFLNESTRKKLSDALKGRKQTQELINKRAAARKGKKFSEESIKKLKESHKGQIPWNKGIKHTEETKQKIKLSLSKEKHPNWGKELKPETRKKISESNKGKNKSPRSEETKIKISENNAKYWKGKHLSEEHKQKLSQSKKGKPRGKYNKQK